MLSQFGQPVNQLRVYCQVRYPITQACAAFKCDCKYTDLGIRFPSRKVALYLDPETMDPGTAIAVGELSLKVISLISKYYSDVKNAKSDIERLDREIRDLHAVFQKTQELTQKSSLAETFSVSASLRGTSEQALVDVKGLESKLDPGPGARLMRRVGKRALKWPFEKKEVNGWIAKFERHKTTLNLALTADQLYDSPCPLKK